MGNENDTPALSVLLPQKVKNQLAVFTVQVAGGFVGKDQTWVQNEGPGNFFSQSGKSAAGIAVVLWECAETALRFSTFPQPLLRCHTSL